MSYQQGRQCHGGRQRRISAERL